MGLKITRGLSCPSAFFLLAHTAYFSLFTQIQKGKTVAELVSEFHKSTNGRNNFFFSQSKLERGDSE
jgi:hypothetical protein